MKTAGEKVSGGTCEDAMAVDRGERAFGDLGDVRVLVNVCEAESSAVTAFLLGLRDRDDLIEFIAVENAVRASGVVPVLIGLVCEASGHSPTLQSDPATVTVTGLEVNIGAIAPLDTVM